MKHPDKKTYKTTVTSSLREFIMSLGADDRSQRAYIELGCDVGYTTLSVCSRFGVCLGIDIDQARIDRAWQLRGESDEYERCLFSCGDSDRCIPGPYRWDVVLIDADHSYESVKRDFEVVTSRLKPGVTTVIFHDYGLVGAGVRRFVDELAAAGHAVSFAGEMSGWNPLGGPTDGPEAAVVTVTV